MLKKGLGMNVLIEMARQLSFGWWLDGVPLIELALVPISEE